MSVSSLSRQVRAGRSVGDRSSSVEDGEKVPEMGRIRKWLGQGRAGALPLKGVRFYRGGRRRYRHRPGPDWPLLALGGGRDRPDLAPREPD